SPCFKPLKRTRLRPTSVRAPVLFFALAWLAASCFSLIGRLGFFGVSGSDIVGHLPDEGRGIRVAETALSGEMKKNEGFCSAPCRLPFLRDPTPKYELRIQKVLRIQNNSLDGTGLVPRNRDNGLVPMERNGAGSSEGA